MIIMDIRIDNFYCFKNFHMNMSYPKKIVDSTINCEYLEDRPNFRYKKVNILMGSNATGKTSIGKMLMWFVNYCKDENYRWFADAVNDNSRPASFYVDFIAGDNELYRFHLVIFSKTGDEYSDSNVEVSVFSTEIRARDSYEICIKRLNGLSGKRRTVSEINPEGWNFSYPIDVYQNRPYESIEDDPRYLSILERTLKTLDSSIQKVIKVKELNNTYAIDMGNRSVIIQNGKLLDTGVLSSGTKAGLDISYIIASLVCNIHTLYFCDELFSYVNSDIEKACLSIFIEKLTGRKQLFFTTHNTDILDMQLPKHSFTFLKKDVKDTITPIQCINAAEYLKRNTDCLKNAVENDLFSTAPDLDKLYEIAEM